MPLGKTCQNAWPLPGESVWPLYRLLTVVLSPLWLLVLALRQGGPGRLGERLGFYRPRGDGPVWIQGVSVGEVRIALRLAQALGAHGLPSALTSTTATGLALALREGPGGLEPQAFVVDLRSCVRRALRRLRPRALVLVETELWPVLFREARAAGIPVFIVNGRISDRALRRTLALRGLYGPATAHVQVAAQSEEHAARFRLLGVFPNRVQVLGNLKYDLEPPAGFEDARRDLATLLPDAQLWVAGSVREGEEEAVVAAHETVRQTLPSARLILAPRHLDRVEVCLDAAARRGMAACRRSRPEPRWDVLVLDTMGELWAAYALGRVAFVGGSLVPLGGQNVLEPAYLGKATLFGPHTENFREDAERLVAAGGAHRVESSSELAWRVTTFLTDGELAGAAGERARAAVERHRGAVNRAALWLSQSLPGP